MNRLPARAFPLALAAALALGAACAGSSGGNEETDPQGSEPADTRTAEQRERDQKLAKLRAAQASACEKMCPELTDCAIESAQENMSEEELAELDLEKTAPRHTAECRDECITSELSPRQVLAIQKCLEQGGDCETFIGCLEGAQAASEP